MRCCTHCAVHRAPTTHVWRCSTACLERHTSTVETRKVRHVGRHSERHTGSVIRARDVPDTRPTKYRVFLNAGRIYQRILKKGSHKCKTSALIIVHKKVGKLFVVGFLQFLVLSRDIGPQTLRIL